MPLLVTSAVVYGAAGLLALVLLGSPQTGGQDSKTEQEGRDF